MVQKTQLKIGSRVVLARPVGYTRVDNQLIQRPMPGCNGVRSNLYHGTIKPSDTVYKVTDIRAREFDLTSEEDIRKGIKTITMRWGHQVAFAPESPAEPPKVEIVNIRREVIEEEPSLAQRAANLATTYANDQEENLEDLFAELDQLTQELNRMAPLKVRYNRVSARIADTLNHRLANTNLNVTQTVN